MNPRRVIVIGAARSGTKLLRDALAESTQVGRVPYDVNFVWRLGNEGHADDALGPDMISEQARDYIRRYVDKHAAGWPRSVIEKTVGNALRVPAVSCVFPDAVFIHLIRDGVDVVESTRRQWKGRPDPRYLMSKARHFPLRLAPRYGAKYVWSLARRGLRDDRRVGTWGPRYRGIDDDLRECSLLTVCARQWKAAVSQARWDLHRLSLPVVEVRYEQFVEDPNAELTRVAKCAGLPVSPAALAGASERIDADRAGAGRAAMKRTELEEVDFEVGDLLASLAYPAPMT